MPTTIYTDYQLLWDTLKVRPERLTIVTRVTGQIKASQQRYEGITALVKASYPASKIPWQFVAVVHYMECTLSFAHHLHNGNPLTARTVDVPAGRPVAGKPPFTFEQSAFDALVFQGLHKEQDWSIAKMLYRLEGYNGYGYRSRGINSPYLWSFSYHYGTPPNIGKYVKDRKFDPKAISQQLGAAVILKQIM